MKKQPHVWFVEVLDGDKWRPCSDRKEITGPSRKPVGLNLPKGTT